MSVHEATPLVPVRVGALAVGAGLVLDVDIEALEQDVPDERVLGALDLRRADDDPGRLRLDRHNDSLNGVLDLHRQVLCQGRCLAGRGLRGGGTRLRPASTRRRCGRGSAAGADRSRTRGRARGARCLVLRGACGLLQLVFCGLRLERQRPMLGAASLLDIGHRDWRGHVRHVLRCRLVSEVFGDLVAHLLQVRHELLDTRCVVLPEVRLGQLRQLVRGDVHGCVVTNSVLLQPWQPGVVELLAHVLRTTLKERGRAGALADTSAHVLRKTLVVLGRGVEMSLRVLKHHMDPVLVRRILGCTLRELDVELACVRCFTALVGQGRRRVHRVHPENVTDAVPT